MRKNALVRVSLMIEGQEGVTWEQWVALARTCEDHGIERLYRSDHYLGFSSRAREGSLDCWTTLAALAAVTAKLRLGSLVSPVTFRHPSLLARAAVTVDRISGGRVEVGIGGGWMEAEHRAYGFPFPDTSVRMAMLAEQLEVVHRQWTEDAVDFEGEHYALKSGDARPKPLQRPHPPLIVGGAARRGTLVPAVRWADEYNTTFPTDDEVVARRRRLLDECERQGREPLRFSIMTMCIVGSDAASFEQRARAVYELAPRQSAFEAWLAERRSGAIVGTVDEVVARLRHLAELGVDGVMLQHLRHDDLEAVALIGREIVPAVA
jgi:F420-dependent oxidoreductase-like protein